MQFTFKRAIVLATLVVIALITALSLYLSTPRPAPSSSGYRSIDPIHLVVGKKAKKCKPRGPYGKRPKRCKTDTDGDGIKDFKDKDDDGDKVNDGKDNCAKDFNKKQKDEDKDGKGNDCDQKDNDGPD